MDETRKTMKQPPEPPKDANGRPMAPPDGKRPPMGRRPEAPKDTKGRPVPPLDGKVAPPDGIRPQRPEGQVTESVSESTASAETTEE